MEIWLRVLIASGFFVLGGVGTMFFCGDASITQETDLLVITELRDAEGKLIKIEYRRFDEGSRWVRPQQEEAGDHN